MTYRCERSITINASPETVWELVQEPTRRLEWDVRVRAVELLTPRPLGKGTRLRITYAMWGARMTTEITMLSWQPYRRSAVTMTGGQNEGAFAASWNFVANPDGSTTWTTRFVLTGAGRLAPVRERVFGRIFELLTVVSQRNLKRLAEAERRAEAIAPPGWTNPPRI